MKSFVQTKSIGKRLAYMITVCSALFVLEFAGIYVASRDSLKSMTELYQTVRANTAIRQVRTLINLRVEIIRRGQMSQLSEEDRKVFETTKLQIRELMSQAAQATSSIPDAHAMVMEAENRLSELEEKGLEVLEHRGELKINMLLVDQFTLESQDLMGRAQVAIGNRSDQIFSSLYEKRYWPLMVSISLALLFGGFALVMGFGLRHRLQRSIHNLLAATFKVAEGELSARADILDRDEIGLLAHAFNKMAKSLEESTVSKAYVENIIESMLDGVLVLHSSGTIVRANREAEKTFGYAKEGLLGAPIGKILKNFQVRDGLFNAEVEGVSQAGDYLPVFVSVAPLESRSRDSEYKVCVIKDITERKKYEEELSERNRALVHANKELEAFSYSVSHDLRAPLRGIDGFSQALLEDYSAQLDQQGQNYLQRIRSGVQKMGHLIDDILGLAKISRAALFFKTVDMSALAESILEDLKNSEPNRATVEVKIQPQITAGADPTLMKVTLGNLLGNAWKYTAKKDKAMIEFGQTSIHGKKTFYVRDNGAGFDMAYADKIFAPFQRLHKQEDFPGTGIGLASVQRVIHRHGGAIWAEAEIDKGATFYFTLG